MSGTVWESFAIQRKSTSVTFLMDPLYKKYLPIEHHKLSDVMKLRTYFTSEVANDLIMYLKTAKDTGTGSD